jgi:hypothetical protein
MGNSVKALLLFPIIVFLLNGCTDSLEDGLPGSASDTNTYHSTGWKDDPQHGNDFSIDSQNCKACHGEDLTGGTSGVSCVSCHAENLHHGGTVPSSCNSCHHENDIANCEGCHPDCKPGSHPIHRTANNKGPATLLICADCHDTGNYPSFWDGKDLANTTVCDVCHSPGGAYNGVDDTNIGAKRNWASGVYSGDGSTLQSGKEKWCVGCHDNNPAVIDGVPAPKVGGDGANYGYFANGHGNASNDTELACTDCHDVEDVAFSHIDGDDRTYTFSVGIYNDGSTYQAGYRLKSIDGQPPMKIPANTRTDDDYRLCFSCHEFSKILDDVAFDTNFNASGPNCGYSYGGDPPWEPNQHYLHVVTLVEMWNPTLGWWDSDWDLATSVGGRLDSSTTCVTCHNVHGAGGYKGSTNEAMIRDGKLVDGRPDAREGFRFSYVIEDTGAGGLPMVTSSGATRASSIGAIFRSGKIAYTADNMCMGCHSLSNEAVSYNANGNYVEYYRDPTIP